MAAPAPTTAATTTSRRGAAVAAGPAARPVAPGSAAARESANALRAHILEVAAGCDVFEALTAYARRRQRGVCVLSAAGTVANVTLRQPQSAQPRAGLAGGCDAARQVRDTLPRGAPSWPRSGPPGATSPRRVLAGGQGQVVGGSVAGALIAAGPVVVVAASFSNVAYERLPLEDGDEVVPPAPAGSDQGGGGSGGMPPLGVDPSGGAATGGLPFFNMPFGMPPMPVDGHAGWPGAGVGRPPFS
ncbi:hypothetical protein OsJ_29032 [Oryza sativa Japonica Group]|uniref:AT-hook motif nuclear-localized protein n=1 Tax=Oryza sativa subsp. japonica TaxID=39947 RepID=A3BXX3_ORYSJ|nr:hypothetical protein OsJ_29032 [Oryza sativa Japonica Group]